MRGGLILRICSAGVIRDVHVETVVSVLEMVLLDSSLHVLVVLKAIVLMVLMLLCTILYLHYLESFVFVYCFTST